MTKTTIIATITITGFVIFGLQYALAVEEGGMNSQEHKLMGKAKAIPDWVDQNFRWYGEGLIGQADLLNSLSFLLDNGHMHLSDTAAKKMQDLRAENAALKKKLDVDGLVGPKTAMPSDDKLGRVKVQFPWDKASEKEALEHLRKAYDLNPNLETKVIQFDKNHDKWIDVLSIDWETSTTTKGDIDRPLIVGKVPNPNDASDRPTEEVAFYHNKISAAHEKVGDIIGKRGTAAAWGEAMAEMGSGLKKQDSSSESAVDELSSVVVLCSIAMEREVQKNQSDLEFLRELSNTATENTDTATTRATDEQARMTASSTKTNDFDDLILKRAEKLQQKVESIQVGMNVCKDKIQNLDKRVASSELMNIDLQNALQKQQQSVQTLSNIIKSQHETIKTIIQNMKA